MSATLIKGKPIAERIRAEVAEQVQAIGHIGLVTVLVGDDPASEVYIRLKHKAALEAGFDAHDVRLPGRDERGRSARQGLGAECGRGDRRDPRPAAASRLTSTKRGSCVRSLRPRTSTVCIPFNAGQLFLGKPTLVGATPVGVMEMLREHKIEIDGARAVVIGRSDIVGKPMAHLLLQAHATVTICHSHTRDLARHTLDADILVAAVGVPTMVSPDMVRAGGVVIDVGINRTDAGLVGDVDPGAAEVAAFMTPVPGGVGPMTIACLLQNAVRCARYRRGELAYPG